jgi:alanine dehydrogenase
VPLFITEAEVAGLLTTAEAFDAVEESFHRLARGAILNPARVRVELPEGVFAAMPCVDLELGYAGLKTYTWLPAGAPFLVVLFSLAEARVAAVLEANLLGERRTAAASAVAATHLARPGARSLGVFGCGRQAAAHVEALRDALDLEEIVVFCRDEDRLAAFCAEHRCEPAEDSQEAGRRDIVLTATTSHDPVVRGEWLRAGALVIAIGANEPDARELDTIVLERATFVCTDSLEQARLEAGDLIEPVERGTLDWLEVHELHRVVVGELTGRDSDEDVVVYKSTGLAAWDVAVAARVARLETS